MNHIYKLISVVFSFRNEEEILPELISRVQKSLETNAFDYELIFVNDASTDRSLGILKEFAREDKRLKVINLSRRFGYNQAFTAGIRYSRGDAVITMDADLQDPPEVILELIEKWKKGSDVIHAVRTGREGENILKAWLTAMAYRLIGAISDIELPHDAGNFKLMSRRVVNEVIKLNEKDPYLRGLVAWVGFVQDRVYYRREKRYAGKGHFPLFRSTGPIKELASGVTSFSVVPLVLSFFFGMAFILVTLVSVIILVILKLMGFTLSWGYFHVALIAFFAGIQLVCLGFVGLFIGRIWNEVSGRPNYIVESTINLEE